VALDAANNRFHETMNVSRVDIGIIPLLKEANRFTGGRGRVKRFIYGEPSAEGTAAA